MNTGERPLRSSGLSDHQRPAKHKASSGAGWPDNRVPQGLTSVVPTLSWTAPSSEELKTQVLRLISTFSVRIFQVGLENLCLVSSPEDSDVLGTPPRGVEGQRARELQPLTQGPHSRSSTHGAGQVQLTGGATLWSI